MNANYKVGDKVRIVDNTCGHGFKLGEIVTITHVQIDPFISYTVDNDDDFWFVDDDDIIFYMSKFDKVTRVEIIDETGRILVLDNLESILVLLQDDDRTLKIFVKKEHSEKGA